MKKGNKLTRKKKKKIIIGVIIGYFAVMLIGYLGVSFYYSTHFFRGTKINGMNCSNKTIEEVKKGIIDKINAYTLEIELRDGASDRIKATDVKLSYIDDNRVDELMEEQNQFEWIIAFSATKKYELSANTTYKKDLVDTMLDQMSALQEKNMKEPKDAYVNDTGETYEIVPEENGTKLDRKKVKAAVEEAIDTGKTKLSLEKAECYINPKVLSDDKQLANDVEVMNKLTSGKITYDFGDDRLEVVDRSMIAGWLIKGEDGVYTLDREKVEAYVHELAVKYDTFGLKRKFTTYDGQQIELSGGDYGWCINKTKTTDELIAGISQGVNETRDPVYIYSAMNKGANDIGSTYVEISIDQQRMWCYKDGELVVSTAVVTGNPNKGNATPKGKCWAIDAKKRDAVLKGEGYSSPVEYWMPFEGNVGIHDADNWRSPEEYGGETYKTSGSHGCVNTPFANAEKIFNAVEIGTAVIVY